MCLKQGDQEIMTIPWSLPSMNASDNVLSTYSSGVKYNIKVKKDYLHLSNLSLPAFIPFCKDIKTHLIPSHDVFWNVTSIPFSQYVGNDVLDEPDEDILFTQIEHTCAFNTQALFPSTL